MASLLNLSCDQIRVLLAQCGCQCGPAPLPIQPGGPPPPPTLPPPQPGPQPAPQPVPPPIQVGCAAGEHSPPCFGGEVIDPITGCCVAGLPLPGPQPRPEPQPPPCTPCAQGNVLQIGSTGAPPAPQYMSEWVYAGVLFATDACKAQPSECTDAQLHYNCRAACERAGGSEADCLTGCQGYYV